MEKWVGSGTPKQAHQDPTQQEDEKLEGLFKDMEKEVDKSTIFDG